VTSHLAAAALVPLVGCALALPACVPGISETTIPLASVRTSAITSSKIPAPTATTSVRAEPQTGEAAAAAFRTWVKQYNAEQWDRHYASLVAAQRKIITEKRYASCRDTSINPTFTWVKTVKTKANVKSKVPGTSRTQPATLVTARLRVQGFTLPITAHMFYEDGAWHWSMTRENLKGCEK